jgi:nitroimidazol reductase NimA-like FMN-containing flavoprotein (pyridoxamine 5'-phosphate oxidase superfamily)
MTGLNESSKKKEIEYKSKSQKELLEYHQENESHRFAMLEKYSHGVKVRYASHGDPTRFLQYLTMRKSLWETKSGSNALRMLEKTNTLISKFNVHQ